MRHPPRCLTPRSHDAARTRAALLRKKTARRRGTVARQSYRAGLLKCAEGAINRLREAVTFDQKLAFQLVKELGLLKAGADGSVDADVVRDEIEVERLEHERRLDRRRLKGLLQKAGVTLPQATEHYRRQQLAAATGSNRRTPADDILDGIDPCGRT